MSELLLIDDDQELCELLGSWLVQEGFAVRACHDGQSARQALAEHAPSAVVLDVMLPDGSGLELLKQLRSEHADLPVLMLSARGEPLDRILGLELGADDYLAKPCDPRELTARLRAVLRRSHPAASSSQVEVGDLTFSPARGVVSIDEREMTLTLSESRILEALLRQPGEPLDKQELAQVGLGRKLTLYDRSLDMHVSNLRKKIGPHADGRPRIVALRSRGYYYSL
ncbi:response regulator transcription factor [Pseudomonas guariconensis]|uniref:response regulator transcription factor n=1 Tax=Pseudomonas TaxID=286 RepID=UPI001CE3D156|nr:MULTISPECIES: response regulator transcription factor [Pseudomonas]MCO7643194.1 response regulator transcription factor [Pseudomonas sp. S 311-6]MCO7517222.1 response regulator transcription factor [Pseudomonas putida]MCO7567906.1 response regulator transcription factor [Pseudomonas mosselii]MCO7595954.1 response regulator transcription factor [Pseudomonas guariconensis]MCO7607513.1 response regulator transcription factor [Pseudomonas guariconensis]